MPEQKTIQDAAAGQGANGMAVFARLAWQLGSSTKTRDKLAGLEHYFSVAGDRDKVWVIALFTGRRPRRAVSSALLGEWCRELAGIPEWLFQESYHTVGDLAETITLLLPAEKRAASHSLDHYLQRLTELRDSAVYEKKSFVMQSWDELNREERFVFNKLITGGFRIGVSQQLLIQALATVLQQEKSQVAHQISGSWDPAVTGFGDLFYGTAREGDISRPYPFYLSHALETEPGSLGEPADWQAEWKWDGIRGQLVKRKGQGFVWSRGEELLTEKFPEYRQLLEKLPDGLVLDGEILAVRAGQPLPFSLLQTRITRKQVSKKQLAEAPVAFFAYDLLEWEGRDYRQKSLEERRRLLEKIVQEQANPALHIPPAIPFGSWEELSRVRERSREMGAEGLMLKNKQSVYQAGRKRGDWWKWKIDPMTIDAVLVYAQKGHGRRSNLYSDYTFAVRDGEQFVSFTRAYSGLTDRELVEVDAFIKKNVVEKFGPVRTVKPELVFEIAFEGISASGRHKSGVALRFPRISRWRRDKTLAEINTLEDLKQMLGLYGK